ncbi:MAG TPA: TIM-barrel domain-containing protein [Gaiellaceae bacterium]|nr:TIM-barrel domain-containing protein [Gaiellaceae bacterium]
MTARRLGGLGLLAFLVAVATNGCGEPERGTEVHVTGKQFSVQISRDGRAITTLGGTKVPFVYWTRDGAPHQLGALVRRVGSDYTVATDQAGVNAHVTVRTTAGEVHVDYRVPGAAVVGLAMTASRTAHFLGTGQRTRWVDMRGTVQPLKVRNQCSSSGPTPFFASTAGFGAWASTTAVGRIGFPGAVDDPNFACDIGSSPCSVGGPIQAVRWCFATDDVAMTIAPGSITHVLTTHAKTVGLPRAPWLPQLALIKWRDVVPNGGALFDDIRQLRSRNIPIGWVLLDNPWEQGATPGGCYGALTFNRSVYPDPKAMITRIHDLGVRFMLWISPQIDRVNCPPPSYPDGWMTGDDKTLVRDLTNPAERADFVARLKQLVVLGVDGFKGDRGDEVNLEPDNLVGGPGVLEQNAYPLLYDRAAAAAFAKVRGTRFASLFRASAPGSSAALPGFVGPDAPQSYTGLQGEIRAAQTAGIAGLPVWGSDVGGYASGTLTAALFVRWAQFAALTPIFEVGGAGPNATFWQLGPDAVSGLRAAATLHYELIPYLYSLALSASKTGIPVVRPLGLTWPTDPEAWASDLELTVGDALLAAPVVSDAPTSAVYLPRGRWVDLFTGIAQNGGRTIDRTNGARDFPLYLRAGSAIPDAFRAPALWSRPWRVNDLLRPGRQGWIAALRPGVSFASAADRGAVLAAQTDAHGRTQISIRGALREQQLLIYPDRPLCRISVGSATLTKAPVRGLPRVSAGWSTWRHAVVVKLSAARPTTTIALAPC